MTAPKQYSQTPLHSATSQCTPKSLGTGTPYVISMDIPQRSNTATSCHPRLCRCTVKHYLIKSDKMLCHFLCSGYKHNFFQQSAVKIVLILESHLFCIYLRPLKPKIKNKNSFYFFDIYNQGITHQFTERLYV